nr:50S ribosomal protein L18, chloroplastic [Tanacetum cinerariifolium]
MASLGAFTGPLQFTKCQIFGNKILPFQIVNVKPKSKTWVIQARGRTKVESPKVRNRRLQKKYNGTQKKPRLSVFCSEKQLYAMLVDDQNKKILFYGSTLQQSVRESPTSTTIEAAQRVGEELVKTCNDLGIDEIASYDRNGFSQGAKMEAFEIALSGHGLCSHNGLTDCLALLPLIDEMIQSSSTVDQSEDPSCLDIQHFFWQFTRAWWIKSNAYNVSQESEEYLHISHDVDDIVATCK